MKINKLTDRELHKLAQKYSKAIHRNRKLFAALLPVVNDRRIYKKYKFHSIYEYAAKLAYMSHQTVDRILRLDKKLENKPVLKQKFKTAQIPWSKIEVVERAATPKTEKEWAVKAENMSKSSLQILVKDFAGEVPPRPQAKNSTHTLENFRMKLDQQTIAQLRILKKQLEKEKKELLTWNQTINLITKILEPPKAKPRKRKKTTKATRYIPVHIKRKLPKLCSYPTCSKPADHIHHPERFAKKRSHSNLKPLCKSHHEIAHNGLIANETKNPKRWRIKLNQTLSQIDKKYLNQRYKLKHSSCQITNQLLI